MGKRLSHFCGDCVVTDLSFVRVARACCRRLCVLLLCAIFDLPSQCILLECDFGNQINSHKTVYNSHKRLQALEGVKEPNAPERPGGSASPTAHPCNCVRNSRPGTTWSPRPNDTSHESQRKWRPQFLVASEVWKSDTALGLLPRGTAYLSVCLCLVGQASTSK